jgi:hypothetical protein
LAIQTLATRLGSPGTIVLFTVGLALGGLLIGYEPIGGDPDRLYRPIKSELARSLHDGGLPFWSDRFGLGVPLVAESHVAAFYPPNWLLYRALDVAAAYRLSMWLHYLALAAAIYVYARGLGLLSWGAALAALAFTLCGAQAIHASHEPFYTALPFLPLALHASDRYMATGRVAALGLLALVWGAQLTVGHFQIQLWTAGFVLTTALWRFVAERCSPWRCVAIGAALICGAGIAAVQLVLSWDLARLVGSTRRPPEELFFFWYPPAHWAELAIPRLFHGLRGGPADPYWFKQGTTGYEACLYVGTVSLMLAFVGLTDRRHRALDLWRFVVPMSFALATLPRWWPAGYQAFLQLPGAGAFRAPGRYTILTSLGLALLAGCGFDRAVARRRFSIGIGLAVAFGTLAVGWALYWAQLPDYRAAASDADVRRFIGLAALSWTASFAALAAWRAGKVRSAVPFLVVALELGILYYHSTTVWGWSVDLPERSAVLRSLAQDTTVGTVAGPLHDLPVRAGRSPAYPYLGMRSPLPNSLLEFASDHRFASDPRAIRILRRFGVTHGVWDRPIAGSEILYAGPDDALDRLTYKPSGAPEHATWYLVRYGDASPAAHVALRTVEVADVRTLFAHFGRTEATDVAWFLPGDRLPETPGPRARSAHVRRWNGRQGDIDHDGTCDLVIRRTYTPGWTARVNDGPEIPVVPVDGGLQSVRVAGAGSSHISLQYRPPRWRVAVAISTASLAAAVLLLLADWRRARAWRKSGSIAPAI